MEIWTTAGWIPAWIIAFIVAFVIWLKSRSGEEIFDFILFFLFVWILVANLLIREEHKIEKVEFRQPLSSLKTFSSVDGNFFLIHSGEKYSGFIKTEKGWKKFIMPEGSEIIPDGEKYYLQICEQEFSRYFIPFIYEDKWSKEIFSHPENCRHEIHVPKGSIKFDFKVD